MTPGAVVVGGGLGGHGTCAALRAAGYDGPITLVGAEDCVPYDRPPLSKDALHGDLDTVLAPGLADLGVDIRLGERATALDRGSRILSTSRGSLHFDDLVVATGAEPVRVSGEGVQVLLRTRADAALLRDALVPGARFVIIGAGWIGAEVATAALARGAEVTCLEGAAAPLAGVFGDRVATRIAAWWRDIDLRCATIVREVAPGEVVLADDTRIPADVVVTAVGVRPAIAWLADSGLQLDGGVAVDANRRSSDPHIYALGDAAARWSERIGARVHVGHWDEAVSGPAAIAAAIVGAEKNQDDVPYFWSDQFGRKIQYVGQHSTACTPVLRQSDDPERWGVAWLNAEQRMTAHLSVSSPRAMAAARRAIESGAVVDTESLADLTHRPVPAR